ncbi:Major cardiolipin synthase ClsA [Phycisphaerae bacterium RAS1]|nr:Major cardiolipin synthase ClsA [Phycisphaerae bacterium RAS1]
MSYVWTTALTINYLAALGVVVSVLRRRKEPGSMVAWVFAAMLFPFLGPLAYWLFSADRVVWSARRRRRRVARIVHLIRERVERHTGVHRSDDALPADLRNIERMARHLARFPATPGNDVRVYDEANETYAAIEEALRTAQRHIHLEYYIWNADDTGRQFRDLLIEKARQGVEVRLLLDSVGCFGLSRRFLAPLRAAGAEVAWFMPLRPTSRRWSLHLRNHRKIVVVDGAVAFTGSQNIGDEYRGRLARLSPWYDTHLRVSGPAALFLQEVFVEDWYFATRRELSDDAYFPAPTEQGSSWVQILPTGPDQPVNTLEQVVFATAAAATHTLRIATPYFVPHAALRTALTHACYRGVEVDIVVPTRTDAPLALWAGRSFYEEIVSAGAGVYEFDHGVLHSKTFTIDDRWCMIGSANMDARSFRLNFEISALIYDEQVARGLSDSIQIHCARSRRITLDGLRSTSLPQKLLEGGARLFSPLV